ncbi:MAG: dipeptidase [Clostridiales bacterium]|jgi:membrane dipeptidase|nr:dipeptidase [Clostridiales bacterium]
MISLVDAHCDTITKLFGSNMDFFDNGCQISLKKLSGFTAPVQFFAIYLNDGLLDMPFKNTLKIINFYYDQVNKYYKYIDTVSYATDILEFSLDNKIASVLALEGGEALEGKISNLEIFYELGIRCITLTHNKRNKLGDGVSVVNGGGLTDFGLNVVKRMNYMDMIVDVSHLNQEGFWDVAKAAKKPFIASHSNSYAICPHKRNLTDDQLKAIKNSGGVVGINLYPPFVKSGSAAFEDLLPHITHMVDLIGPGHVGLGCDFDGIDEAVGGISDVCGLSKLYDMLLPEFGKQIADGIFSGNFLRLLDGALPKKN